MNFHRSDELRLKAHDLIPGGCHTYAKGDDQYPALSPGFIARGLGSHVWDVDGNEFIEYGQGNRCVTLGHAYPEVIEAAQRELPLGANFTRPAAIEIEAAEQLLQLVPAADMVKFCKDGSDATTAALKIARAWTARDKVAICRDHPFFAINDWFISTTPLNAGIPQSVRDLTLEFNYNDVESLRKLFAEHPGQISSVFLEPAKYEDPQDGFLHKVKELCHAEGALFVLDEMISGFRWHNGGGQAYYGIEPDLSTFGKAIANGFSVSALAGKREYMELGGLRHNRERVFMLSTTHGGETHALAAAIATMKVYQREPVIETLFARGQRLLEEGNQIIRNHGLEEHVGIFGKPVCLIYYTKDQQGERSQAFRSLLLQEMIRRGVLMATLVVSYTHSNDDINKTLTALDESLAVYKRALNDGVEHYLVGPPSQTVYRRYNTSPASGVQPYPPEYRSKS